MSRELLIAVSPGEAWGALREAGEVVELRVARSAAAPRLGEFWLGRIAVLRPELPAAFVDLGLDRPGFLSAEDALPGLTGLTEGQAVLVQVVKEARAEKAAGLSLRPRLAGQLVDLVPGRPGVTASRRLDPADRERLVATMQAIAMPEEGFFLRPAAVGAGAPALAVEAETLRARWRAVEAARRRLPPPARLEAKESPTTQLLAALADPPPDAIVIDDRAAFVQARHWLQQRHPALLDGLRAYAGAAPLLEAENAAAAVESALASRIALAGGGALTIEGTAAATMIDVDVGSPDRRGQAGAATLAGNLCAADAVARHIRLRGLAGPIVVDFIGMARRGDRGRVLERLTAALARYATEADVLGWTRLGHVELVRPRRHTPLSEVLYEHVPGHGSVKRPLTVALEALRAAQREAAVAAGRRLALYMSPEIVAVLAGEGREARRELEERLGRPLEIVAEPGRPRESFDIRVT